MFSILNTSGGTSKRKDWWWIPVQDAPDSSLDATSHYLFCPSTPLETLLIFLGMSRPPEIRGTAILVSYSKRAHIEKSIHLHVCCDSLEELSGHNALYLTRMLSSQIKSPFVRDDLIKFCTPRPHPKRVSSSTISLETLLRDLSLSSGDGRIGVGVDKAAALLAVLELGTLSRADTNVGGVDLGAAGRVAVVISDAAAGRELRVLAVANVLGTGVVGSQGEGRDGDCGFINY